MSEFPDAKTIVENIVGFANQLGAFHRPDDFEIVISPQLFSVLADFVWETNSDAWPVIEHVCGFRVCILELERGLLCVRERKELKT